jgi:tripartite-type tricarboxylate transporter receptor subunit TctC
MTIATLKTAGLVAGMAMLVPALAQAQSGQPNYQGKQISVVVGDTAGSAYTSYAQLVQRHLGKQLPGNPQVLVRLMPGAGGLIAGNYLAEVAPKDGTTIGALYRGLGTEPLLQGKDSKAKFDPRELVWLYSLNSEVSLAFAWHATGVTSIDDLRKKEFLVPIGGISGDAAVFGTVMNNLAGTKFKMIAGYQGSAEQDLAIERGEVEGRLNMVWNNLVRTKPDWLKDKKVNLLFQFSLTKHEDLPNLPLATDFISNPEDKKIMEFITSRQTMGRPYAAPHGISPAVATTLRGAFDAMIKDKDFLADVEKSKLELHEPMPGAQINALIDRLYDISDATLNKMREASDPNRSRNMIVETEGKKE